MSNYDLWLLPPDVPDLADEVETACNRFYPADVGTDAWECEDRSTCLLCNGTVCATHDDVAECGDCLVVHEACHRQGCSSSSCAEDRRDDALLARDEEVRGR